MKRKHGHGYPRICVNGDLNQPASLFCSHRATVTAILVHAMNYRCCCVLVHAMNYSYCCAILRSEKTHTLAKYVYASKRSHAMNSRCMQWITAAAAPSCGQKKHTHAGHDIPCYQLQILGLLRGSQFSDSADTVMQRITTASKRSRAMNYRCCCAIVRSEQTHTLATTLTGNRLTLQLQACNELRLLPRDHVQWITAAAASSCMQWITATAAPSCGQKKHTRWRSTPTLRNDHVQWITAACNELQLLLCHRAVRKNTHATKLEL